MGNSSEVRDSRPARETNEAQILPPSAHEANKPMEHAPVLEDGLPNIGRLNRPQRWLSWCAGSSHSILTRCPHVEVNRHTKIGTFVILTAMLAAFTMMYCAYSVSLNWPASIIAGIAWGILIFNLDRYLISTLPIEFKSGVARFNTWSMTPRLLLSILIGGTIAIPFELLVFKHEIATQLTIDIGNQLSSQNREIEVLRTMHCETTHGTEIKKLTIAHEQAVNLANDEMRGTRNLRSGTTSPYGRGRVYEALEAKALSLKNELLRKQETINECMSKSFEDRSSPPSILSKFTVSKETERKLKSQLAEPSLLTQYTTLQNISKFSNGNNPVFWASLILPLIIIFVEVSPVFSKYMTGPGIYDMIAHKDKSARLHSVNEYSIMLRESITRWEASQKNETDRFTLESAVIKNATQQHLNAIERTLADVSQKIISHWKTQNAEASNTSRIDHVFQQVMTIAASKLTGSGSKSHIALNPERPVDINVASPVSASPLQKSKFWEHFESFVKEGFLSTAKKTPEAIAFVFSNATTFVAMTSSSIALAWTKMTDEMPPQDSLSLPNHTPGLAPVIIVLVIIFLVTTRRWIILHKPSNRK